MRTEQSLIWLPNKLKDKINQSSSYWKINSYLGTSNLKPFCNYFEAWSFQEGAGKDVPCPKDNNRKWTRTVESTSRTTKGKYQMWPLVETVYDLAQCYIVSSLAQLYFALSNTPCDGKWIVPLQLKEGKIKGKRRKHIAFLMIKVTNQSTLKTYRLKPALNINP